MEQKILTNGQCHGGEWIGLGGVPPIGGMTRVRGLGIPPTQLAPKKHMCNKKSYFCLASHSSYRLSRCCAKAAGNFCYWNQSIFFFFGDFLGVCSDIYWPWISLVLGTAHHCRDERSASRADPAWQPASKISTRECTHQKNSSAKHDILPGITTIIPSPWKTPKNLVTPEKDLNLKGRKVKH